MPFSNVKDAADLKWAWALGSLVLLGAVVISFVCPFAAPPLGVALMVGGIVAYRQSTSAVVRAIAAAAIAAGTLIMLTAILVGLGLTVSYTTEIVTEGTEEKPMTVPWEGSPSIY